MAQPLTCPHADCGQAIDLPTECPHCRRALSCSASTLDAGTPSASPLPETVDYPNPDATQTYHPQKTGEDVAPQGAKPAATSPMQLGRFQLKNRLGEGAFGLVYRAYDPQLDREVAVKVAKSSQLATPHRVQRFLREARAAANLRHPNIVPVHDSGQEGSLYYIASTFIPGHSVDQLLADKQLDRRQGVQIVRQIAEALAYAHRHGVVHRDVKPANVMLDSSGDPLLMDFGLAARTEPGEEKLTQDGTMMGTPAYLAPEQAEGAGIAASDQYSLGCMLYEILTGRTPFEGSPQAQMRLHRTQDPPSPRTVQPDVPRDLETICLKCLEKDPNQRYPDCQALADDLRRWLEGEPILARPLGVGERFTRWTRRNPLPAALTGAIFLALALGMAGSLWQMDRAHDEALRADAKAKEADDKATAASKAEEKAAANLKLAQEESGRANTNATKANEEALAARKAERLADANLQLAQEQRTRAETFLTRAEGLIYAGKLVLAQEAFQNGKGTTALRYLDETQWDRRGWEHRYLRSRLLGGQTIQGFAGAVLAVSYSPDGKRILSVGARFMGPTEFKVWDAATGAQLHSVQLEGGASGCIRFSPDGQRIVAGWGEDIEDPGQVKMWDAATGKLIRSFKGQVGWVRSVAFSPDGKQIVCGGGDFVPGGDGGEIHLWEADTGKRLRSFRGQKNLVSAVSFSPDGKQILAAGGNWDDSFGPDPGEVKLWDAATGKQLLAWNDPLGKVHRACFSPDGKQVITLTGSNTQPGEVKIWDATTGKEVRALKVFTAEVAFSPDGKRLLTRNGEAMKMWDFTLGREVFTLTGQAGGCMAFSPDGRHLVSGGNDGTLRIWDALQGQGTPTLKGHLRATTCLAFSQDGKRLVSGGDDYLVRVWDVTTGQEIAALGTMRGPTTSVAISPEGKRVFSLGGDRNVKVLDVETKKTLFTLGKAGSVSCMAMSPDGKLIATGGADKLVSVWLAETGQIKETITIPKGKITALAFNHNGKQLVLGAYDDGFTPQMRDDLERRATTGPVTLPPLKPSRMLKIWDLATHKDVLVLDEVETEGICFSPDGRRMITGYRKVRDTQTGKLLFTLKGNGQSGYNSVCFSPDGTRIITGSSFDKTVTVWDAARGEELLILKEPTSVNAVAFCPDGQRLACATGEAGKDRKNILLGEIKLFEANQPPSEFLTFEHPFRVLALAYSQDGSRIVTSGGYEPRLDGVKVWDARKGLELLSLEKHKGPVWCVAISADGKRIVSGGDDRTVRVWDGESGDELFTLEQHTSPIAGVAISRDGTRIISASNDHTLKIWDAQTGKELRTLKGHTYWVHCVAISPDGKRIVSGSGNYTTPGEVKVWDVESGKEVRSLGGITGWVSSVALSSDGKRILASGGARNKPGQVKVWDVETEEELLSLKGLPGWVSSVAFSLDGTRIVTAGAEADYSGSLRVWDATTGQMLHSVGGLGSALTGVRFSPNGRRLVFAGYQATVKIWLIPPHLQSSRWPRGKS